MNEDRNILEYSGYRCVVKKCPETKNVYLGYVVNVPMLILIMGNSIDGAHKCLVEQINRYKKHLEFGKDGKGL